jgi:hypothetical protein
MLWPEDFGRGVEGGKNTDTHFKCQNWQRLMNAEMEWLQNLSWIDPTHPSWNTCLAHQNLHDNTKNTEWEVSLYKLTCIPIVTYWYSYVHIKDITKHDQFVTAASPTSTELYILYGFSFNSAIYMMSNFVLHIQLYAVMLLL